jgi:SPP1 family predicted phage head-tail adaptor
VAAEVGAWTLWAQVSERSGSNSSPYMQTVWNYDYTITVRYERTRVIGSNYTVDYDGKRMVINSIAFDTEAGKKYAILRCSCVDPSVSTGGGGSVPPLPQIMVYNYEAVTVTDTFVVSTLIGKTVFGVFKDGVSYRIITTGSVSDKECKFTSSTGTLLFSVNFEIGELLTVQYIR